MSKMSNMSTKTFSSPVLVDDETVVVDVPCSTTFTFCFASYDDKNCFFRERWTTWCTELLNGNDDVFSPSSSSSCAFRRRRLRRRLLAMHVVAWIVERQRLIFVKTGDVVRSCEFAISTSGCLSRCVGYTFNRSHYTYVISDVSSPILR